MIQSLQEALQNRRLSAELFEGTLNVRHGQGPMARAINIDPAQTLEWLDSRDAATRKKDVSSWANAVEITLSEPKRSDARHWTFVEAAGSIFPTIEGAGFVHGVRDATGGEPAWAQEIDGDTDDVMAWVLRLGRGLRPLTVQHVEDWGVTDDRIVSAGRSLLFHSTRQHSFSTDERDHVLYLRVGDGHDAARLWVVGDVFFTDIDDAWRFAIPSPDLLLATKSEAHADSLASAAMEYAEQSDYPLTTQVWKIGPRGPQPTQP